MRFTSAHIAGLLLTFLPILSFARLDDTVDQCTMRYGYPVMMRPGMTPPRQIVEGYFHLLYDYEGWRMRLMFIQGRVAAQTYEKQSSHPNGPLLKTEEVNAILKAESKGLKWESSLTHPLKGGSDIGSAINNFLVETLTHETHWKRSDGAYSTVGPGNALIFYSAEGIQAALAAIKAQEKAKPKVQVPRF